MSAFEAWVAGSSLPAQKLSNGKKAPPPSDYAKGKWVRTLNAQETCYLYAHTTTYQIQGTRPDDFEGGDDEGPAEDPFASFPTCHLSGIEGAIDQAWNVDGKVPLLLCDGDEGYNTVRKSFEDAGAQFLCVKPFVQGVIKTKIKFADHVETARQRAIKAMKAGKTLVIELSDVGTPDWKEKICNVDAYKKVFPIWMLDPTSHRECDKHGQVFKKDDKSDGPNGEDWDELLNVTIKNYRIVYISACGPGNYEKEMTLTFFPQNKWTALRVKSAVSVRECNIKAVVNAIDTAVHALGKVPLILDETENTDTFMAFQRCSIIEMKALILKKGSIGIEAVLEEMRTKLVQALKNGQTLLLRLTDSAPDILGDYSSDSAFPAKAIFSVNTVQVEDADEPAEQQYGGFGGKVGETTGGTAGYAQGQFQKNFGTKGVFDVTKKEWLDKVFRDADKEAGAAVAREGFKVVVTSNFTVEKVKERLASLPLGSLEIIKITE